LRFLELVLNVLLDASGCSFTLRVNLFGTALFTVSVLGGFFGLVSGVVLRFFGSLSSIFLGHVRSFSHPVYYEGSSSRRFLSHRALAALRAISFLLSSASFFRA
jgi:hypothetical protein